MYQPTQDGFFGDYGGNFTPPDLRQALQEVEGAFNRYRQDNDFQSELEELLRDYVGRPSPLYYAKNLSEDLGGGRIFLKREDLNHTGAHKINNSLGQALLAKRMGKKLLVAETGAGQHGVATATAAALLGLKAKVFMGTKDMERQKMNVARMQLLGAQVVAVAQGAATLKNAVDAALENFAQNQDRSFYLMGSAVGPHPYPLMVREFQAVIGREARWQMREQVGRLPDILVACVGGGSNAIGLFAPFYYDESVKMVGVEAGGYGLDSDKHAASLSRGKAEIIHGFRSYVLLDGAREVATTHSIAAGLDYPAVGPEHCFYKDTGRAQYLAADDTQALRAWELLAKREGIIAAMESAHALAYAMELAPQLNQDQTILVNLSGRGDKDMDQLQELALRP